MTACQGQLPSEENAAADSVCFIQRTGESLTSLPPEARICSLSLSYSLKLLRCVLLLGCNRSRSGLKNKSFTPHNAVLGLRNVGRA